MNIVRSALPLGLVMLIMPIMASAQTDVTESDWLPLVVGHKGEALGAEVRDIKSDEATGEQTLIIAIPKASMSHPNQMEEVVVIGQAPQERKPLFNVKYETQWLDDPDDEHYGLLIRVGKDGNWPIRLFMHSDDGPREIQGQIDP